MRLLRGDGPPLLVGHRGAALLARENTLDALRVAVEHGVDAVEFDVLTDGRGRLVLAHSRPALADDAPPLDDALAYVAAVGTGAHVDLKERGIEAAVAESLARHGLVERSLVTSLDAAALRDVRRHEPALRVGLSYPDDRFGVAGRRGAAPFVAIGLAALQRMLPRVLGRWLDRAGASAAVLHHALVTPALVRRCHARGAAVWAWTVNDAERAARLADWGADAIISDDPRVLGRRST